jgi:hypothetical protein
MRHQTNVDTQQAKRSALQLSKGSIQALWKIPVVLSHWRQLTEGPEHDTEPPAMQGFNFNPVPVGEKLTIQFAGQSAELNGVFTFGEKVKEPESNENTVIEPGKLLKSVAEVEIVSHKSKLKALWRIPILASRMKPEAPIGPCPSSPVPIQSPTEDEASDKLPIIGSLKNGVKYCVARHPFPHERCVVWMVVQAGLSSACISLFDLEPCCC